MTMRVLQINVVYGKGSTGKIVYDIHSFLTENNVESHVAYGRGVQVKEKNVVKIAPELLMKMQSLRSKITGSNYSGCYISTYRLIHYIKQTKPDIVHLHCLNGYFVNIYKLLEFLKRNHYPTVLTLHAEFMHTAGCGYAFDCEKWKNGCYDCKEVGRARGVSWLKLDQSSNEWNKMSDAFNGFDQLVICPVSEWLKKRAQQSAFLKDKTFKVVMNGLNTDVFKYYSKPIIRDKLGINENQKMILHVTPDFKNKIKGGKYVVQLAKEMRIYEDIIFVIVGFNGDVDQLPSNIIPIEHTEDQIELAHYYSEADLTLLTSQKETFSMVCAESLCCGTPIVGFEAGAPETISILEYSSFVEYPNVELLKSAILKEIYKSYDCKVINRLAHLRYSKERMNGEYMNIYREML